MARIDRGNALEAPVQQPGARFNDDGYGLLTATVVWKADGSYDMSIGNRGSTCPINSALAAHKYGVTYDASGLATITVDYIGIDPDVNGGAFTNPQVGTSNGLTTANITTHPNFFVHADGYYNVIAGTEYAESDLGPLVKRTNGTTGKSYVGENGACFERENGGRFIGFVDPAFPHFYGKTNFLAPQTSFSGHFYTNDPAKVQTAVGYLNTTSSTNNWGGNLPDIVPTYAGTNWQSDVVNYNQLLLAQVNVEDYGLLYKVNYEVRYNEQGWPDEVYVAIASA